MTLKDINIKVKEIIFETVGYEAELVETTNFIDDLGFDSLIMVELIVKIEDKFNIEIAVDDLVKIYTLDGLVDSINRQLN